MALWGSSKTLIHPAKRYKDLSTGVFTVWMKFLRSSLLLGTVKYLDKAKDGGPTFCAGEVCRTKRFLKHLAVIPIEKCQHRLLIE